jgi:hypothetical protein
LISRGYSGSNHRAKSRGYFSANSLQTLSKLTILSKLKGFLTPRGKEIFY